MDNYVRYDHDGEAKSKFFGGKSAFDFQVMCPKIMTSKIHY